jgi:hypothetical protein
MALVKVKQQGRVVRPAEAAGHQLARLRAWQLAANP